MSKSGKVFLQFLFGFTLLAFAFAASAQTSANATLNVFLADVRSIKINPAQSVVTLNFNTAADYASGISSNQISHLEVTSTGGYLVKVKASNTYLQNRNDVINVNTISITPAISAANTAMSSSGSSQSLVANTYLYRTPLNVNPNVIIDAARGSSRAFYDVKYQASGGTAYMNKAPGNYSVTITYTIEPN